MYIHTLYTRDVCVLLSVSVSLPRSALLTQAPAPHHLPSPSPAPPPCCRARERSERLRGRGSTEPRQRERETSCETDVGVSLEIAGNSPGNTSTAFSHAPPSQHYVGRNDTVQPSPRNDLVEEEDLPRSHRLTSSRRQAARRRAVWRPDRRTRRAPLSRGRRLARIPRPCPPFSRQRAPTTAASRQRAA